jgi:hypothetical protein
LAAEPGDDSFDRSPAHKAFHARLGTQPSSPLRADSLPRDAESAFLLQDETTLRSLTSPPRSLESVVDLAALREASPYRSIALGGTTLLCRSSADALQENLERISALYDQGSSKPVTPQDCHRRELAVEQQVKLDPSRALEITASEVAAHPFCACEIVKAAIRGSAADAQAAAAIAEAAILAAPQHLRIISQCAIAEQPDALPVIQKILARLDPHQGLARTASAKEFLDAKSAKLADGAKVASAVASAPTAPNPLNLNITPALVPPPTLPPRVTDPDP